MSIRTLGCTAAIYLRVDATFQLLSYRAPSDEQIHTVVDADGLSVRPGLTPGEAHDNRLCSVLLAELQPRTTLLADRGYDAEWIGERLRQKGMSSEAILAEAVPAQ